MQQLETCVRLSDLIDFERQTAINLFPDDKQEQVNYIVEHAKDLRFEFCLTRCKSRYFCNAKYTLFS